MYLSAINFSFPVTSMLRQFALFCFGNRAAPQSCSTDPEHLDSYPANNVVYLVDKRNR